MSVVESVTEGSISFKTRWKWLSKSLSKLEG
jgi:hypothetical protein